MGFFPHSLPPALRALNFVRELFPDEMQGSRHSAEQRAKRQRSLGFVTCFVELVQRKRSRGLGFPFGARAKRCSPVDFVRVHRFSDPYAACAHFLRRCPPRGSTACLRGSRPPRGDAAVHLLQVRHARRPRWARSMKRWPNQKRLFVRRPVRACTTVTAPPPPCFCLDDRGIRMRTRASRRSMVHSQGGGRVSSAI